MAISGDGGPARGTTLIWRFINHACLVYSSSFCFDFIVSVTFHLGMWILMPNLSLFGFILYSFFLTFRSIFLLLPRKKNLHGSILRSDRLLDGFSRRNSFSGDAHLSWLPFNGIQPDSTVYQSRNRSLITCKLLDPLDTNSQTLIFIIQRIWIDFSQACEFWG